MDAKQQDLLNQIAIDVAVIKSQIEEIADLTKTSKDQNNQITELRTQMKLVQWVGGILGAGFLGFVVKIFTGGFFG